MTANAKEKLRFIHFKKNNLSEYIDYWSEFEKRFQRIGSILNYRPIFKEYYQEAFLELLKDNVQHVEIRYIFGQLFDEKIKIIQLKQLF
jgi:adenosine deaminase CECR1